MADTKECDAIAAANAAYRAETPFPYSQDALTAACRTYHAKMTAESG